MARPSPPRLPLAALSAALALIASASRPSLADGPAPGEGLLHLVDGGFAAGGLVDSPTAGVVRWRSPAFAGPFDFPLATITAVHLPMAGAARPTGDYGFELAGGDVLFGGLLAIDDARIEVEVARIGRLNVRREAVRRIFRWRDAADLIYLGPNGLAGWTEATPKSWREEAGQVATETDGAEVRSSLGLPPLAAVELEVSWKGKPDFSIALGVDDDPKSAATAFRIEATEGNLVALRETEDDADVSLLNEIPAGPGRAHLQVYLDQERGRLLVFSSSGKALADIQVRSRALKTRPGVALTNKHGDVRLEQIRVGRWNGEAIREVQADQARIHKADGSVLYGQVTRYDPASREFLVREKGANAELKVAVDGIASLFLSGPADGPKRPVRAVNQDGSRLSGAWLKVEAGGLWLDVPNVEGPVRLPLADLRSLVSSGPAQPQEKGKDDDKSDETPGQVGNAGVLELDGLSLIGALVDSAAGPGSNGLDWSPRGSLTHAPIQPGVSGRILYREPNPTVQQPLNPNVQQGINRRPRIVQAAPAPPPAPRPVGVAEGLLRALAGSSPSPAPAPPATTPAGPVEVGSIHLRTGDVIPSLITRIDESGVHFKSSMSESTFVPNEKIKAVELSGDNASSSVRLTRTKRDRLVTLPRMQKESPPTQLVRARNGDYLRGRVVSMDDKALTIEVRLDNKIVPRDRLTRIIWLHADELDPARAPAPTPGRPETRVQALQRDGVRLTFTPTQSLKGDLIGRSDVLGPCRVRVAEVDQLLIGSAIEKAAAALPYGQWHLVNAPEPKVATDEGDASGRPSGIESALIGKAAPDFTLTLLDGKTKFHLADLKGRVVVLDFWATWCGPCIQAMPQVDRVAREFEAKGVKLVAVNLQEGPDEIKAMLERHKLAMEVALDRDGVVAEKYAANAIPQTVIIDRDGKVARLYVGGGAHLDETLRDALKAVVDGQPEAPAGPTNRPKP